MNDSTFLPRSEQEQAEFTLALHETFKRAERERKHVSLYTLRPQTRIALEIFSSAGDKEESIHLHGEIQLLDALQQAAATLGQERIACGIPDTFEGWQQISQLLLESFTLAAPLGDFHLSCNFGASTPWFSASVFGAQREDRLVCNDEATLLGTLQAIRDKLVAAV